MFLTDRKEVVERMSRMPRTVGNKLSGEKVTFVKTTQDTKGESLEFITNLDPEDGIFPHRHTYFTEIFQVLEGELTLKVDGHITVLKADDSTPSPSIAVEPYKTHSFWNHTNQFVTFKVTMYPAGDFEPFVRIGYGLENDQKTYNYPRVPWDSKYHRFIRSLQSILGVVPKSILTTGYLGKLGGTFAPVLPIFIQKIGIKLLSMLAVWKGKDKEMEHYYMADPIVLEGDKGEAIRSTGR